MFICLRPPPLLGFCLGSCTVARQEPINTPVNKLGWGVLVVFVSLPPSHYQQKIVLLGACAMPDLHVVVLAAPGELAATVLLLLLLRLRFECCLVLVSQCEKTPSRNNRQDD